MFSFRKASIKWLSLSGNDIFDDDRYKIWRHLHIVQYWAKFSNFLVRWSITMVHVKNYETML